MPRVPEQEDIPPRDEAHRLAWYLQVLSPPTPPFLIRIPPQTEEALEARYLSWTNRALPVLSQAVSGFHLAPRVHDSPPDTAGRVFIPPSEFGLLISPTRPLTRLPPDRGQCYIDFARFPITLFIDSSVHGFTLIRMLRLTETMSDEVFSDDG